MATILQSPTGTITVSVASCLSFAQSCRNLLRVENLSSGVYPCYILLNDSALSPQVSSSNFDFVVRQGESLTLVRDFLSLFPISTLGIWVAQGAPNVRGI